MIIDGHAHASGDFSNPDKLVKILDSLGVDKIVLCPGSLDEDAIPDIPKISYSPISKMKRLLLLANRFILKHEVPTEYFEKGNDLINSIMEKHPERIIHFYWVNPMKEGVIYEIENELNLGRIKGIKLHQCLSDFSNDSLEMIKLSEFAGKNNLPIFIHVYSHPEVRKLVKLARKHPKTNFILAHFIGLEVVKRKGKDLNNIYFDTSTYFIISKRRIKYAIKHFGADHVLLGSDSPFGEKNLENNINKFKEMKITKEEKNLILGQNMVKLLNL